MQRTLVFSVVVVVMILISTRAGLTFGAVAIGQPGDVAKQGVSMGYSFKRSTVDDAKSAAVSECKDYGSAESKRLCKVVTTFQNRCVALAIDPKAGTPGFGWAVADTKQEARANALANCRASAGRGRANACIIVIGKDKKETVDCDGSAD